MSAKDVYQDHARSDFIEMGKLLLSLSETAPEAVPVAAKALKIKSRKAFYLIEIAKAFEHIPAPREQLLRSDGRSSRSSAAASPRTTT